MNASERARIVSSRGVDMLEQHAAVANQRDGRMQPVRLARQGAQLLAGRRAIDRLGKALLAERQRLVGAEHEARRHMRCDRMRLGAGQNPRHLGRRLRVRARFDCRARRGRPGAPRPAGPPRRESCRRTSLFEARIKRFWCDPQAHVSRAAGVFPSAASSPPPRFPRSSAASRRSTATGSWRKAGANRRPPRPPRSCRCTGSSSRCALSPSSRFSRICTMRSGLA